MALRSYLDLVEAKSTLPPVQPGFVRLYRGDASAIKKFDTGMTSMTSLFGNGIYLTNNRRVAGDYVSKGNQDDVLFILNGAKTQKAVLDFWLRRQAAKIDSAGVDHSGEMRYWNANVPFADGTDWNIKYPRNAEEEAKRYDYARQKWLRMAKDYEVRVKLDGTGVIQKKLKKATGSISVFDLPESYLDQALAADASIEPELLSTICWALRRHGDRSTADDVEHFVKQQEWEGDDTSFRQIYTSIGIDSPIRSDPRAIEEFRESLIDDGYTGIRYVGGISMGGGYKHMAYVLWDDEMVNKHRVQ